jgi:hypothetical protein
MSKFQISLKTVNLLQFSIVSARKKNSCWMMGVINRWKSVLAMHLSLVFSMILNATGQSPKAMLMRYSIRQRRPD